MSASVQSRQAERPQFDPDIHIATWQQAHDAERRALFGAAHNPQQQAAALCLSGGGIRSAAFCLGVLQGLEKFDLLEDFHYLSSVSGGGFAAALLTRSMCERKQGSAGPPPPKPKLPALEFLRRYTNYLAPQPGLFSLDTWQALTIWIRNVLINWGTLLPILVGAVSCVILYYLALCALASAAHPAGWQSGLFAVSLLLLGWSVLRGSLGLPSHEHDASTAKGATIGLDGRQVFWLVVAWALLWSVLIPPVAAPSLHLQGACAPFGPGLGALSAEGCVTAAGGSLRWYQPSATGWHRLLIPAGSFVAAALGYLAAWLVAEARDRRTRRGRSGEERPHAQAFRGNVAAWLLSCALSSGLLWGGLALAEGRSVLWVAALGAPWVVLCDVLRTTAYVALRREGLRSDLDREWLARISASKLRLAILLGFGFGAVLALPALVLPGLVAAGHGPARAWHAVLVLGGVLSGPAAARIASAARSALQPAAVDEASRTRKTPRRRWLRWLDILVASGSLLFMATILMLAGRLVPLLEAWLADLSLPWFGRLRDVAGGLRLAALVTAGLIAASALLALYVDGHVSINRFSLHGLYRNRLIRAFLGSARAGVRRPDAYTNFDPADNVRLHDCHGQAQGQGFSGLTRLFPVLNVTLNMTATADTARAERRGAPFTITPLHCGSNRLHDSCGTAARPDGRYVETWFYAGGDERDTGPLDKGYGLTLGTAMAISGAAVSPSMGYHSSRLAAFMMTLFNLRLGAWLPNPAMRWPSARKLRRSSPAGALAFILSDLFGYTTDSSDSVYLSDGGHFDNLGLYEMLRRECDRILVVDAGSDERYVCADLGRVLTYAKIDLDTDVDFLPPLGQPSGSEWTELRSAKISYRRSGKSGTLLYLKPCVRADSPVAVRTFDSLHADFPHAGTGDQFFDEISFESYRALGQHQLERAKDKVHLLVHPRQDTKLSRAMASTLHEAS